MVNPTIKNTFDSIISKGSGPTGGLSADMLNKSTAATNNLGGAIQAWTSGVAKTTNVLIRDAQTHVAGARSALNTMKDSAPNSAEYKAAQKKFADSAMSAVKDGGSFLSGAIKSTLGLMGDALITANNLWAESFSSVESGMRAMTKTATKMIPEGKLREGVSGFIDNMITSMMFMYKDTLAFQKGRYAAGAQIGFGGAQEGQAQKISAQGQAYKSLIGRDEALKYTQALAGIGATDSFDKVMAQSLKLAGSLQMDSGAVATLTRDFMSLGMSGEQAGKNIEEQYRKVQYALRGTGVPVAAVMKGITEGATAARFMNVDIGLLTNTMSVLGSKTANLGKFGVDFSKQSVTIAKELGGLGQGNDALNMFFGSNMGKENIGMKAWTKGTLGTQTAEGLVSKGGGFEVTGGDIKNLTNSNAMTAQKIIMLKDMMTEQTKNITNPHEALYLQKEIAKKIGGVGEATALALATTQKEDIGKITTDPAMANQFKDEKQIWTDIQSIEAKNEAHSRRLVELNMNMFKEALIAGKLLQLIATGDKEGAKAMKGLLKQNEREMFDQLSKTLKGYGGMATQYMGAAKGILGYKTSEEKAVENMFGLDMIPGTSQYKERKAREAQEAKEAQDGEKKALGGAVTGTFQFGERGDEIYLGANGQNYFLPGASNTGGTVIPNDQLTMGNSSSHSSNVVNNYNFSVTGATNQGIVDALKDAIKSTLL